MFSVPNKWWWWWLLLIARVINQSTDWLVCGFCCDSVLDLDAFERCNKAEGLGVSDGTTQAKNLLDTDNTCKLFRFLQLLCEGHNLGNDVYRTLASCLINAPPLPAHRPTAAPQGHDLTDDWSLPCAHFVQLMPISVLVWVRSFIEPDFFKNNVPFDNATPIYLINLLWKLGLGLGLDSRVALF